MCPVNPVPITTCFFDIDGTITDDGPAPQIHPSHVLSNAVFSVLRDAMVAKGWDGAEAAKAIVALADRIVFWDYPDFIVEFDLPATDTWRRIVAWHRDHLVVYEDAVALVKELRGRGLKLCIASNNPLVGCLLKLQRAGLGGLQGTAWFDRIFCANLLRGQKHQPAWWQRALAQCGCDADEILVIGDSEKEDHATPASAGFKHFAIVDRRRARAKAGEDGVLRVGDLREVAAFLAKSAS